MLDLLRRKSGVENARASPLPGELLASYLRASDGDAPACLEALLKALTPRIEGILRKEWGCTGRDRSGNHADDLDDLRSETLLRLIRRLGEARSGTGEAIRDVEAVAALLAGQTVTARLRRERPAWTYLSNRIRYLLTRCGDRTALTLWRGDGADRWTGWRWWRTEGKSPRPESDALKRRTQLEANSQQCSGWIFPDEDPVGLALLPFMERLFRWLDTPLLLPRLIKVSAEIRQVREATRIEPESPHEVHPLERVSDARGEFVRQLEVREFLRDLWFELGLLPLRQRTALVLTLSEGVIRLLPAEGLASLREIAALLEMPAEELAGLWPDLPLDDRRVAERLHLQPRQVIVLRQNARDRLRRRLLKLGWDYPWLK